MWEEDAPFEYEATYARLRQEIAMLSAMYRDIIILHYYDGLSVEQISAKLDIAEGTVKWRLSEARRKLKKECTHMEKSALRPVRMHIDIYGSGNYDGDKVPFPSVYINDALSQNILYYCYEEALGVEELAKLCGVPAYYVEERVDNLVRRQAVIEPTRGKYQTNFVITQDKHCIYAEQNAQKLLLPLADRMIEALKALAVQAGKLDFYKGSRSDVELLYLYGLMALEHLSSCYNPQSYLPIAQNYDGYWWRYIGNMETGEHLHLNICHNRSAHSNTPGTYYHDVYGHFGGFAFGRMLPDTAIDTCVEIWERGKTDNTERAAYAAAYGALVRGEDGNLRLGIPAFNSEQKRAFDEIVESVFNPLMPEYAAIVKEYIKGYKKMFPKHLHEDVGRISQGVFVNLYKIIVDYGQQNGLLERPPQNGRCDVLIQWP